MKISKRGKLKAYSKTGGPRNIGRRCKSFNGNCCICVAWAMKDRDGKFPSFEELSKELDEQTYSDQTN